MLTIFLQTTRTTLRTALLCLCAGCTPLAVAEGSAFVHPGGLHTTADFTRIKTRLAAMDQPWTAGWQRLTGNRHAGLDWQPAAVPVI